MTVDDNLDPLACRQIQVIDDAISSYDCERYIATAIQNPWRVSKRDSGSPASRAVTDIEIDATALCFALRGHLPAFIDELPLMGIPPDRVFCLRYCSGDYFPIHTDGPYQRGFAVRSLSLLVYLNDNFEGGATNFPDSQLCIVPKAGRAVCFEHSERHEGLPVVSGIKYALYAFVVYGPRYGT